jgi:hypothetical protein
MNCNKNGIKKEGESCTLNNNCIYPNCMKKETLEEAAERIAMTKDWDFESSEGNGYYDYVEGFTEGAKWQAERMYSEEDMIRFAEFIATYLDKNKNVYGQMLHAKSKYDGAERTIDLLEQFKKK